MPQDVLSTLSRLQCPIPISLMCACHRLRHVRPTAGEVESRDEVAEKVAALADAVLGVAAETADPALQRSAAEMFAFAACIGSTPLAASLLRTLCDAMARSPSAPRWGPSLCGKHYQVHLHWV